MSEYISRFQRLLDRFNEDIEKLADEQLGWSDSIGVNEVCKHLMDLDEVKETLRLAKVLNGSDKPTIAFLKREVERMERDLDESVEEFARGNFKNLDAEGYLEVMKSIYKRMVNFAKVVFRVFAEQRDIDFVRSCTDFEDSLNGTNYNPAICYVIRSMNVVPMLKDDEIWGEKLGPEQMLRRMSVSLRRL